MENIKYLQPDWEVEAQRTEQEYQLAMDELRNGLDNGLPTDDLNKLWKNVRAANSYRLGTKAVVEGRPYTEIAGINVPSQLVGLTDELLMRPEHVATLEGLFTSAAEYKDALGTIGGENRDPRLYLIESRYWQEGI